jgi:hypothetical protein
MLRVWLLALWCSGWSHCHPAPSRWWEGWELLVRWQQQAEAPLLALVLQALSHLLQALQEVQALFLPQVLVLQGSLQALLHWPLGESLQQQALLR